MRDSYVWQLQFDDSQGLEHAFQSLMDAEDLDDCSVESDELLIRFTGDIAHGEALVAGIYQMGALRWCSRHKIAQGRYVHEATHSAVR